ncbi:kinase-like domain-containing protein [Mycena galopus ATCC 62051]|nr:kinase-like domain-containing protein [Mycena galopus ATCC 62051]
MPTSERHKSVLPAWGGRPALPVRTDSNKLGKPVQRRPGKPSPSTPLEAYSLRKQTGSAAREGETWAPRPPPEDVYDRLQDFFPELDLDKPATEMISEGTGGTVDKTLAPVPSSTSAPPDTKRVRGKSIRSVVARAVERKKIIDRTSRAEGHTMVQQKSTKLWGSKLEEMDTSNLSEPSSTSEGATTFKWVRGELIGRGTYGRVYLALNATTGDMIAVKQIEIPRTASDNNDSRKVTVVQALKLESETLKLLDHPNIVQYLGFEETPTNLSIFMEYVPGGSIGSCVLEYGRFDEDVTKSFTSQILDGLAYLHSKGIVHRDLKSDSILVEMTGVCKISEFGISKRTDRQNDAAMSSVFWMAPELINPQKKGDSFKIDIWSIGCVALEMWAGTRPWLGDEVVAVMFKLFQAKLPPPVPDGLVLTPLADDFRKSCFAINPDERPSAAVLRHHPYLTISPGWQFDSFATKPSSVM